MESMTIYKRDGSILARIPSSMLMVDSAVISSSFMSNDTLTINCTSGANIAFEVGCYVDVDGARYRINQSPQKARNGASGGFDYTLVFESVKYDLANVRFLLPEETEEDFLAADLSTLVGIVADNACRVYGPGSWVVGSVPHTEVISQKFTEQNCLAALQSMMRAYESDFDTTYEFRVNTSNGHNVISVVEEDGGQDAGISLAYGHKGGLYKIERKAVSSENIVSRLFAYGSSDNIPPGYRHSRLCMKDKDRNESYVESPAAIALFGIKEGYKNFDSVKPRARFAVTSTSLVNNAVRIHCDELSVSSGGFHPEAIWQNNEDDYQEWLQMYGYRDLDDSLGHGYTHQYYDGSLGGTATRVVGKHKYKVDGEVTLTFNTGKCAGISFHLVEGSSDANGNFTLVTQKFNEKQPDEYSIPTHGGGAYDILPGDEFVISGILLPIALVERAEAELEEQAMQELAYRCKTNARYAVEFDQIAKDEMDLSLLVPGNFVRVVDDAIGLGGEDLVKIGRVTKDLVSGDVSMELTTIKTPKRVAGTVFDRGGEDTFERVDPDGVGQTTLTCHLTPNHDNTLVDPSSRAYNNLLVTEGTFSNYSLSGTRRVWRISTRVIELSENRKYDLYVQASKKTGNATIVARYDREVEITELVNNIPTDRTSGKPLVNPFVRTVQHTLVVGALDSQSYYFKIGTISEARKIPGRANPSRTLTLDYGTASVPSEDIELVIEGRVVDIRSRVECDLANVDALNRNMVTMRDHIHSIVQTMQTGKVNVGGRDMDIGYDWSLCDDKKCQSARPEDLIPTFENLK